jgi:hypothetical protein
MDPEVPAFHAGLGWVIEVEQQGADPVGPVEMHRPVVADLADPEVHPDEDLFKRSVERRDRLTEPARRHQRPGFDMVDPPQLRRIDPEPGRAHRLGEQSDQQVQERRRAHFVEQLPPWPGSGRSGEPPVASDQVVRHATPA